MFNKRFSDNSVNWTKFPVERIIMGIVIGLLYALTIYSFAYIFREAIRLMSSDFGHLPLILNPNERLVYNWLFAAIALVFGNSIAISFIISGPNWFRNKRQTKIRRIINDQIFLNSSFAFWFLKICYIFGIFSIFSTDFNFLPEFTVFIIILVIVLYLDIWKHLSIVLKKKRFKVITLHFVLFLLLSFVLSKFELIDYRRLDNEQLSLKPQLELPKSYYNNVSYYDYWPQVYLKDSTGKRLSWGYEEGLLEDAHLYLIDEKSNMLYPFETAVRVSADKSMDLELIKLFEAQMNRAKIEYMIFATHEETLEATRFSNCGIKVKLKKDGYSEYDFSNNFQFRRRHKFYEEKNKVFEDTVKVEVGQSLLIDGSKVLSGQIMETYMRLINENTIFQYQINSKTKYGDYITSISAHLAAIDSLRENSRRVTLRFDDIELKYINKNEFLEEEQRLRNDFPFIMFEKFIDN